MLMGFYLVTTDLDNPTIDFKEDREHLKKKCQQDLLFIYRMSLERLLMIESKCSGVSQLGGVNLLLWSLLTLYSLQERLTMRSKQGWDITSIRIRY